MKHYLVFFLASRYICLSNGSAPRNKVSLFNIFFQNLNYLKCLTAIITDLIFLFSICLCIQLVYSISDVVPRAFSLSDIGRRNQYHRGKIPLGYTFGKTVNIIYAICSYLQILKSLPAKFQYHQKAEQDKVFQSIAVQKNVK